MVESKPRNLRELAIGQFAQGIVGRAPELQRLHHALIASDAALLVFIHGIAGVGKSALITEFARSARDAGVTVIQLDCRTIEPTDRGFLKELADAIGSESATSDMILSRLAAIPGRVVLTIDTYEVFRLLDGWLRDEFLPELPHNVRVVLAGREGPSIAWQISPIWQAAMESMNLSTLSEADALTVLQGSGLGPADAHRINRFASGHPLALKLAVASHIENPARHLEESTMPHVLDQLVRLYFTDIEDLATRDALEAMSVVRRMTMPLLRAMLPELPTQDIYQRIQASPFVQAGRDGLFLHDAVREAIAGRLRAGDPIRYLELRRRAWEQLRGEMANVGIEELWRYTADSLYLLENPNVREAFFPSGETQHSIQRAKSSDGDAILAIVRQHEPQSGRNHLESWWERYPEHFLVLRDRSGEIAGFYLAFEPSQVSRAFLESDPITQAWLAHLREDPVPARSKVLFVRRWLTLESGDLPCNAQADCWLDIKRLYMRLRPQLRRVYTTASEQGSLGYREVTQRLGFVPIGTVEVGTSFHLSVNDFGPESVDGWLSRLIGNELGVVEEELLDREALELVVAGTRVHLTRLEFAVMQYLDDRRGRIVTRHALLNDVWGYEESGSSNVVDSVIKTLRRKLGARASDIETVVGVGYRLRHV